MCILYNRNIICENNCFLYTNSIFLSIGMNYFIISCFFYIKDTYTYLLGNTNKIGA